MKPPREQPTPAFAAFLRKVGLNYPWLHPDFDPESLLWRERASRARDAAASRHITDRGGIDGAVRRSDRIGP